MSTRAPRVAQYMSPVPHTVDRGDSLTAAHLKMRQHDIRHLLVMDGGRLVGVVSMDDLHLIESLGDVDQGSVPVEDAMSTEVYTVPQDQPIDDVAEVMAERKLSAAIVVDGDDVVGVFTTTDALSALLRVWRHGA